MCITGIARARRQSLIRFVLLFPFLASSVGAQDEVVADVAGASDAPEAEVQETWEACLGRLETQAREEGVSDATIAQVLRTAEQSERVLELDRAQPEFTASFADYYKRRVSDTRVSRGREMLAKHADLFRRVQQKTGVPGHYIAAFWGLETNYGSYLGNMTVTDSLATLACDPRRSSYFSGEVIKALRIVDSGDVEHEDMVGSWAGAMGNFQFMPSAYLRYAVDADGDGRRDLWGSLEDAVTSAGGFLESLGWQTGLRWGREVYLPEDFDYAAINTGAVRPLREWRAAGVTDTSGYPVANLDIPARILLPAGHEGPAFTVYENFDVIMRWNRSEYYAITVGRLADRIAGAGKLHRPIPPSDVRLSRATALQLQEDLLALGHSPGEPDGLVGPATRAALASFQASQGLLPDGHVDQAAIDAVRQAACTTDGSCL